jgi:stage III sporulation protein AD
MEIIYKIIAIGLITCISVLIVKPVRNDFSVLLTVVGGIIIILFIIEYVSQIFTGLQQIVGQTGVNGSLFKLILKIVGIGYLAEFTSSICSDAGVGGLGDKVLFGAKIVILAMALPIVTNILEIVVGLLPT